MGAICSGRPSPEADGEESLSYGQRALWFLQQLSPASPAYNSVHAARISAELDVGALVRAVGKLVERHPALRTTFSSRAGEPIQVVHPPGALPPAVVVEDATGWSEERLRARLGSEVYRPFDLEAGPLLRLLLLRRAAREHVAIISLHHIVTDLWSFALFLRELGIVYTAERAGVPSGLAPPRRRFGEHVRAERELLAGPRGDELWAYWRDRLGGELAPIDLATDRPRPAAPSFHGGSRSVRLDAALTSAIASLGRAHGASPFMTMLSALQVLLHRYTGQQDLLVGSPSAGRSRGTADVFGYFVNLVLLRGSVRPEQTFAELLDEVRATARSDFAHAAFPHALLVERLQAARPQGAGPLVRVVFTWQKTTRLVDAAGLTSLALGEEGRGLDLGELPLASMALPEQPSPFDLTLLVAEAGAELVLTLEYQTELFEAATIERMLEHLVTLLRGATSDPDRPISRLPLLGADDRAALLELPPARARREAPPVQETIRRQAERSPDAVAVLLRDERLTYRELDQRANQLARYLQRRGARPGALVAVCLERSIDTVVALLAILKTGAGYLPMDPGSPPDRLAFVLSDSGAAGVVTHARLRPALGATTAWTVCVDLDRESIAGEPGARLDDVVVGGDDVAYVIYTSGSTGTPKGVVVPHSAFAAHLGDVLEAYGLGPQDRVLQFASTSFDASLEQIVPALAAGARLVLRGPEIPTPRAFHRLVREEGLTIVNVPPAFWSEWVREVASDGRDGCEQLRLVIVGGDVLQPDALALWARSPMAPARLLNAYGPTETTITATIHDVRVDAADGAGGRSVPIGHALPSRSLYVLDRHGEPSPAGVPGELHVGGPCVARGYLARPELTAARFVPDPFDGRAGAVMFRTGDIVRRRLDGALEFLGRADDQVKIRGFRVGIHEVEATLREHAAVGEAAVLVREVRLSDGLEKRLVAYVAPPPGRAVTSGELRAHMKARVPDYMVPSAFVVLDVLPHGPGGKLDRSALPVPALASSAPGADHVAPRTWVEEVIAGIWAEVLSVEHVGVFDDFFELGGHSLLATRVASRIGSTFGLELPVRRVFEHPSVEGLALVVAAELAGGEDESELRRLLQEIEDAGAAQEGLAP